MIGYWLQDVTISTEKQYVSEREGKAIQPWNVYGVLFIILLGRFPSCYTLGFDHWLE